MKTLLEEYGGVIFIFLMGLGFVTGIALIFSTVLKGWVV